MKTLSERVLDMASTQNKRASKAQRVFMIYGDEILQALDKGLPKRWIWETLRQEKENCIPRYERFLIHLRRFLKAKRQESTPEENITKAPPTPASAPAPKTAVPTASAPAASAASIDSVSPAGARISGILIILSPRALIANNEASWL